MGDHEGKVELASGVLGESQRAPHNDAPLGSRHFLDPDSCHSKDLCTSILR